MIAAPTIQELERERVRHRTVEHGERPPQELYTLVQGDGGYEIRSNLHLGQAHCWYSKARFTFMIAGTQVGKTSYGPWHLYSRIVGVEAPSIGFSLPGLGGGDYIAVTASYDLFKLKMLPETLSVFEHVLKIGRYWSGDRILELKEPPMVPDESGVLVPDYGRWADGEFTGKRSDDPRAWARVILRSAESPGGLESASAKMAWLDECGQGSFTLQVWEAIVRRLSLKRGPVFAGTTPYVAGGWMRTEIVDRFREGDPDVKVVRVASRMNPSFPEEEYEDRKRRMNPQRFAMMYEGKMVRMAGLIYPDFSAETMTMPMTRRLMWEPYGWSFIGGIDFGWNHPTACVVLAVSPDGVCYLVRSYRKSETLLSSHYAATIEMERWLGEWVGDEPGMSRFMIHWYGDPSAKQAIEELAGLGLWIEGADNDVIAGIDRLTDRIRTNRFRLYGPHPEFVEEMDGYHWQVKEDEPTDKPVKIRDDLCDAARYAMAGVAQYVELAGKGSGGPTDTPRDPRARVQDRASGTGATEDVKQRALGRGGGLRTQGR